MRFKLTENRIDDLMKRIQNKDLSDREEDNINPFEVQKEKNSKLQLQNKLKQHYRRIDLLTIKEAEQINQINPNILKWPEDYPEEWWLQDKGHGESAAASISKSGEILYHGCYIGRSDLMRPVIYFDSDILTINNQYELFGQNWVAISQDSMLYDGDVLVSCRFDENTNDYNSSYIKKCVNKDFLSDIQSL